MKNITRKGSRNPAMASEANHHPRKSAHNTDRPIFTTSMPAPILFAVSHIVLLICSVYGRWDDRRVREKATVSTSRLMTASSLPTFFSPPLFFVFNHCFIGMLPGCVVVESLVTRQTENIHSVLLRHEEGHLASRPVRRERGRIR